jgi:hypothetical protein
MNTWALFLTGFRGSWLAAVAAASIFGGCDQTEPRFADRDKTSSQTTSKSTAESTAAAPASPTPQAKQRADPSETANANAQPMKPMSKQEESTSMPQPAQANDHSTLAGDGKK